MRTMRMESNARRSLAIKYAPLGLLLALTHCNQAADIKLGLPLLDERCAGQAEGAILPNQIDGDCALIACDGQGHVILMPDPVDIPDDGDPCTDGRCDGTFGWQASRDFGICYTGPAGTENVGICRAGVFDCHGPRPPEGTCMSEVRPGIEVCDVSHVDEDCNGQIDEAGGPGCSCGDGFVQASDGEACDDKNDDPDDGCTPDCKVPRCGDGFIQRSLGENCDNGEMNGQDGCPVDCRYRILQLALGGDHSCALFGNGRVKCWGGNYVGQLGLEDTQSRGNEPVEMGENLPWVDLGTGQKAVAIAAGDLHTCAILEGGTVKCWGYNGSGQLGLGDSNDRGDAFGQMGDNLPIVDLGTGMKAVAIAAGIVHSCVVLEGGSVKCWGFNGRGELGLGDMQNRGDKGDQMGDKLPTLDLGTGHVATSIAVGYGHSCVVLSGGGVKCWGANGHGQLGLGDVFPRGDNINEMGDNLPLVDLGVGAVATAVSLGLQHSCARFSTGKIKCWGANNGGQLGLGDRITRGDEENDMRNLPTIDLGDGAVVRAVAARFDNTCAILEDGRVHCWGFNWDGELGLGHPSSVGDDPLEMGNKLIPVDLGSNMRAEFLGMSLHVCTWLKTGVLKCWGANLYGQLGLGDIAGRGNQKADMGDYLPAVELL